LKIKTGEAPMNTIFSRFATGLVLTLCLSLSAHGNEASGGKDGSFRDLTLPGLLETALKTHEDLKNVESQVERARAMLRKTRGLNYPTLDFQAQGGREKIDKEYGADTNMSRYDAALRANQLVTDFGKTREIIARAQMALEQAEVRLASKRQQVMQEGITAYINIIKARERLRSARRSEDRIKELTGVEETLVEKKAGLSSDLLQAKSQLAGAMALRVQAQGELSMALNRFQAVFSFSPGLPEIDRFSEIAFPFEKLPMTLEEAESQAQKQNPELRVTLYDTHLAQQEIEIAKTAFFPQLNLFAEAQSKENDDGLEGYKNELSAGLEFRYNLYRGGADQAELSSAVAGHQAMAYSVQYVRRLISEQVRNSWEQLSILRQRSELLKQQAEIVENFLELAKKERTMGTRSLLDVLNGEINFINASAAAIAANQDTKIAAFNLFFAMGSLEMDLLETETADLSRPVAWIDPVLVSHD
jgi:adhesin transport system outer membrane protein